MKFIERHIFFDFFFLEKLAERRSGHSNGSGGAKVQRSRAKCHPPLDHRVSPPKKKLPFYSLTFERTTLASSSFPSIALLLAEHYYAGSDFSLFSLFSPSCALAPQTDVTDTNSTTLHPFSFRFSIAVSSTKNTLQSFLFQVPIKNGRNRKDPQRHDPKPPVRSTSEPPRPSVR